MSWAELERALAHRRARGQMPRFWWRDDDAAEWTPALERLVELARRCGVPLAVAAIPAQLSEEARRRLTGAPHVTLVLHGLRHQNHAPAAAKKAEFGPHRPLETMLAEVALARALLPEAAPVFVPPWNRIDPALARRLPEAGLRGLSSHGRALGAGLAEVNTTIDPIDWRGGRGFIGEAAALAAIIAAVGDDRPIGLLTHHAVMTEALWRFCATLAMNLRRRGTADWPTVSQLFTMPA